jgi:hypothetical protein
VGGEHRRSNRKREGVRDCFFRAQTQFDGACLDGVVIVGNEIEDAGLDLLFLRSLGADVRRPD